VSLLLIMLPSVPAERGFVNSPLCAPQRRCSNPFLQS
jgi:hypothetical protein